MTLRDSHAPCPKCKAPPAAECYAFCSLNISYPNAVTRVLSDMPTTGVVAIETKGKKDSPPSVGTMWGTPQYTKVLP